MNYNFWKTTILGWEAKRYDSIFSKFIYSSLLARQHYLGSLINQLPAGAKVLELGCGSSRVLSLVKNKEDIEYVGVDISAEAIALAQKKFKNFKKATWICASIEDLANIKADYAVSAGLMDWVTDQQFENFLINNNIKYHCHSFSLQDYTLRYYLHQFFTKTIQLIKKIEYKPKYFTINEISVRFKLVNEFKMFRDSSLSFGCFIHNLPDFFLKNSKNSLEKYFKNKKNKFNLFEFFYKKKELNDFLKIKSNFLNQSILEIGSGTGIYSHLLLKNPIKELIAIDAFVRTTEFIQSEKMNFILKKFEDFCLENEKKFHKIFCIGIIEFVDDVDSLLTKIAKYTWNESDIFITVPLKKTAGYFFYKNYHQKINHIKLNNLSNVHIENKIQAYFPQREIQIHSFGYLNVLYHIKGMK